MSVAEPAPDGAPPASASKPSNLSAEDQAELAKLDTICDRIKRAVPEAPYILSTPSLHPYSHWSRQEAQSWMMGHLFEPSEESLQYRTYLYREPYQDCFVLQPGEDDPPPPSGPRRKLRISLSAYKSKQANGVITPGSKRVSPNLPPTISEPAPTNGVKRDVSENKVVPDEKVASPHVPKQPASEVLAASKPEMRPRAHEPAPELPQKVASSESKPVPDGSSLQNPYDLPPILSPTLPPNIKAELDRLETQRKRAESNASTSSSDKKDKLLSAPSARPEKHDDRTKEPTRVRSTSMNGTAPTSLPPAPPSAPKPKLVVKIKYSKRQSATIEKILRLPPARKAPAPAAIEKRERPVKTQAKASDAVTLKSKEAFKPTPSTRRLEPAVLNAKAGNTAKAVGGSQKRARDEEDAPSTAPAKRQKAQVSDHAPSTPSEYILSSPAMSNKSSAQKNQGPYVTPRKDIIANKMIRTGSAEGNDSTPGRSAVTPSGSKHVDVKPAPTSAPVNGTKHSEFAAFLQQTFRHRSAQGRSLKHESQKLVDKSSQISKDDQKRAAVIAMECIIAYVAAFYVQDFSRGLHGKPSDFENTWKTLLPLCLAYGPRTRNFPHLDGLRYYLMSVISSAICTQISQNPRIRSASAQAHDSPHDAATSSDTSSSHVTLLAQNFITQARYYTDARMILSNDDIKKHYPRTWNGRETNMKVARDAEKLPGGRLRGPYFLPLANDTTPIQAVRFGIELLREYCENEGLKHGIRVNLEKSE
ncbi:hypothetical protein BCR34DRAFT_627740 [Clohesyomyces aquaticus]|uniref:Uncharacterized protein n=1 Tax=Clohesyomyces aquaticus TaxID=1231657 RepID=A0A1Y1YVA1_9PLEO|nr:hypothetical protein BCR34DRAFT_627740 [Clohesyomyces aquaticus]